MFVLPYGGDGGGICFTGHVCSTGQYVTNKNQLGRPVVRSAGGNGRHHGVIERRDNLSGQHRPKLLSVLRVLLAQRVYEVKIAISAIQTSLDNCTPPLPPTVLLSFYDRCDIVSGAHRCVPPLVPFSYLLMCVADQDDRKEGHAK